MKKIKKSVKLGALILPVLLLISAVSFPVALADSSCEPSGPCSTTDNITATTENLEGSQERKVVIDSWKNKNTKLLMKKLIGEHHCTPWLSGSKAQEITVYENGEVLSHSTVFKIPFKAHGKELDAQVVCRDNGSSERVLQPFLAQHPF